MSNFKIYLERTKNNYIDFSYSLNKFENYLAKARLFNEEKLSSLDVIRANPEPYIKKFLDYCNNKSLYIDLIVRTGPDKKIEISLKNENNLEDSISGNESKYTINDTTFDKIYEKINGKEIKYATLDEANEAMKISGKNVLNLNKKYEASNIVFLLNIDKLKYYLEDFFIKRHKIETNISIKEENIKIKNSIVELKIKNINNNNNKINIDLVLNKE
jgi:hypothetical protein